MGIWQNSRALLLRPDPLQDQHWVDQIVDLLFYLRIFSIYGWFRTLCWTIAGIVVAFTVATVFSSIFKCRPVEFAFNKKVNGGHGTYIDLTSFCVEQLLPSTTLNPQVR